ncbi:MAG: ABC transporter permease, partial [Longimicrobiales bacterium]
MMNLVWQDARYALRMLVKRPAFTSVAVITLALGVGANTAVFSVVRAVLLSPPPFADPDRLFIVSPTGRFSASGEAGVWSYPDFEVLRDQTTSLRVAAFSARQVSLSGGGDPERLEAEMVSANYFALLGLMPALGRGLPAQGQGEPPSIVLGHELWQRRFAGELGVIGRTVELDGVPFQVTGVAPVGFRGQTGAAGVWVPITDAPALMNDPRRLTRPFSRWLYVMARSGASASPASVAAELDVIAERLRVLREASGPDAPGIALLSLSQATTDPKLRRTLVLLLSSAGLVLLITCGNLANVLLARAVGRRREIAVRRALGAGRARLARQLFTENLLLGAAGGTIALALAYATIRMLASIGPAEPAGFGSLRAGADLARVKLDAQVLAFNFAAALTATVLFGLAPAVRAARVDLSTSLKDGLLSIGTFSAGKSSPRRGRSLLAVVQIASAVVLLTGAGLLLESLVRLQRVDLGVHEEDVLTVGLRLPPQRYDETAAASLYGRALERVATLPGIASAAVATSLPVARNSGATIVRIEGRAAAEGEDLT